MDIIVNALYDENLIMCLCNIISFVFGLEVMAYLFNIVANITKTAKY